MEKEKNSYYSRILKKIEEYQRGSIPFEELKLIPKEDLIEAMREECKRISNKVITINRELGNNFSPERKLN